jgi:hypothetical protein
MATFLSFCIPSPRLSVASQPACMHSTRASPAVMPLLATPVLPTLPTEGVPLSTDPRPPLASHSKRRSPIQGALSRSQIAAVAPTTPSAASDHARGRQGE